MVWRKFLPIMFWIRGPGHWVSRWFWLLWSCTSRCGGLGTFSSIFGWTPHLHKIFTIGGPFPLPGWSPWRLWIIILPFSLLTPLFWHVFDQLKLTNLKSKQTLTKLTKRTNKNGYQSCIMSLFLNFTLESSKGGHSNKGYSRDITPNCHNCCNL